MEELLRIARESPLTDLIERNLPTTGRVLEAGCGLGQYVLLLRERGRVAVGADWSLEVLPAGAVAAAGCVRRIAISGLSDEGLRASIAGEAQAAERRLSPGSGEMVQAVWFDGGAERSGRLLLTIHHLAVDGVSWRILVPDLAAAWAAIRFGAPRSARPVRTASASMASCNRTGT